MAAQAGLTAYSEEMVEKFDPPQSSRAAVLATQLAGWRTFFAHRVPTWSGRDGTWSADADDGQ